MYSLASPKGALRSWLIMIMSDDHSQWIIPLVKTAGLCNKVPYPFVFSMKGFFNQNVFSNDAWGIPLIGPMALN